MSGEPPESETGELLSAIGKVRMPEPRVLEDAREVLWSAIASEMLGIGPSGEQATVTARSTAAGEDHRRTVRRRQPERPRNDRRMSAGGGDPGQLCPASAIMSDSRFAWPVLPREADVIVSRRRFAFDRSFEPRDNGFVESSRSRRGLPSRWAGVGAKLPPALENLAGPAGGVVELPIDLAWSGDRSFDLADPVQRYLGRGNCGRVGCRLPRSRTHRSGACQAALDEEFSLEMLRDQLAFASTYPDEAFSRYGAKPELIAEVKAWALDWSTEIGLDMAESESWPGDEDDQDAAWDK